MKRRVVPPPFPVSLLGKLSYVVNSQHSAQYEGIRRVYPRGMVNLAITRFTVRERKRSIIPISGYSGLGLILRGFRFILDRFMLWLGMTTSGQFSPTQGSQRLKAHFFSQEYSSPRVMKRVFLTVSARLGGVYGRVLLYSQTSRKVGF